MKHSTDFTITGTLISYEELEQIWNTAKAAGEDCKIRIRQSSYNDGPYGTSTTTYIEIEAS